MLLEAHGHRVELAVNGREAVDLAIERVPDLIVMDLDMPVMDGFTAMGHLRSKPETKAVPVICMSAYLSETDWHTRALETGFMECLVKPVDWDALEALLVSLQ